LTGFDTFEVRKRADRLGRNPKTGEPLLIKSHRVVVFVRPAIPGSRAEKTRGILESFRSAEGGEENQGFGASGVHFRSGSGDFSTGRKTKPTKVTTKGFVPHAFSLKNLDGSSFSRSPYQNHRNVFRRMSIL
jgi:hypothetical protein